jgi:hypothetical protein
MATAAVRMLIGIVMCRSPAETPEPVAVSLVITDETLLGEDDTPAAVARGLVSDAVADERSRAPLRRLYRHPRSGALVAMESRSRCFPRGLARIGIAELHAA